MQSVVCNSRKMDQIFRTLSEQVKRVNVDTVTLNPAVLGLMRGGSPHTGDFDNTSDELIWVGGTTVGAELDEIWRESRGDWTHPIKDFYDPGTRPTNEPDDAAKLLGSCIAIDQSDMTPSNLFAFCWVRNGELLEFVARFIEPYADELRDVEVEVAKAEPDAAKNIMQAIMELRPVSDGRFDIYSVSAPFEVIKAIGNQKVNPNFLAVSTIEVVCDPCTAEHYRKFNLNVPPHKLKIVFHDFELSQEQLDSRTALTTERLSQLVVRLFDGKGNAVRYLVFDDLYPETVKFKLDAASNDQAAKRTVNWLFKAMHERKEFPGEL